MVFQDLDPIPENPFVLVVAGWLHAVPRTAWLQGADLSSHSMDFCVPTTLGISVFSAGIKFQAVFLISFQGHACEQQYQGITPAYPGCHTLAVCLPFHMQKVPDS